MAFWALVIAVAFIVVLLALFVLVSASMRTTEAESDPQPPDDQPVHRTDVRDPVEASDV